MIDRPTNRRIFSVSVTQNHYVFRIIVYTNHIEAEIRLNNNVTSEQFAIPELAFAFFYKKRQGFPTMTPDTYAMLKAKFEKAIPECEQAFTEAKARLRSSAEERIYQLITLQHFPTKDAQYE